MIIIVEPGQPEVRVSMLTATSVTLSWTQPALSFPVAGYTVSVRPVAGNGICGSTEDSRPTQDVSTNTTTFEFSGLQEFSTYRAMVTARFTMFTSTMRTGSIDFTTLSTGMFSYSAMHDY